MQSVRRMHGNGLSTTKTYNNKGQLLSIQTGANDSIQDLEYSYNINGTMLWRKDHRHSSITEAFLYDNLKRLTASIVGTDTISIEYASNGNIESKSDLGDYAYSTIHPNAVNNVSGSDSIGLNEENISYTSFNKIDSLTRGDNSISFMYGSDYSRKKSVINVNNVETVKYYSGIYEKSKTLTDTTRTYYIMAYGSIVAMYKKTATGGNMYYVHTDHLGSVNCVTDNTGSIVQESSYDPCYMKHGFL